MKLNLIPKILILQRVSVNLYLIIFDSLIGLLKFLSLIIFICAASASFVIILGSLSIFCRLLYASEEIFNSGHCVYLSFTFCIYYNELREGLQ